MTENGATNNEARYDYYRLYYIHLDTVAHIQAFHDLEAHKESYTFYGRPKDVGQTLTIMVPAHKIASFTDMLKYFKVNYKILTYNFQEKIDRQLKDVASKNSKPCEMDWDRYFHLETINAWLDKQAQDHPEITLIDMGTSTEGLPIKGVKFARNPKNTAVFIESGIHPREWIAPATATYILNELLYSKDPKIQKYANDFNWLIFPVVNPDGYKYTFESDRMWRKNRKQYGNSCGVDLNRNYPFHWNEIGSSDDPSSCEYSGPSAGSEIETQRLMTFIKKHRTLEKIQTYFSLHSFSQYIMFPYAYTLEKTKNYDDLKLFGDKAVETIKQISGQNYTSGSTYETIYPSSGGSNDWAHSIAGIPISYTFELRGPSNTTDLFILPANQIKPTGQETFAAIMTILKEASNKNYYNV